MNEIRYLLRNHGVLKQVANISSAKVENCQLRILSPAKIYFRNKEKIKIFSDEEKIRVYFHQEEREGGSPLV